MKQKTLEEHIDAIRSDLKKELFRSEAAVSSNIVLVLLGALGWPNKAQIVVPQYQVDPVESKKVDFALCVRSKPRVFIEVKNVGKIEGAEKQVFGYAFHEGVPIAVVTDGRKWRFFYVLGEGGYGNRKVHEMDLIKGDSEESAKRFRRYLDYQSICKGEATKAIKEDYRNASRQREAARGLSEAWNELVEEADESLLGAVAKKMEDLYRHRPTDEQVLAFLKGLDKSGPREIPLSPTRKQTPPSPNKKSGARGTRLVVTMPNGERVGVDHNSAADTFVEVIERLGIEQVESLECRKAKKNPLVSTSKHRKYQQRKCGRYYVLVENSTREKKRHLERIASTLRIRLKVEIVAK